MEFFTEKYACTRYVKTSVVYVPIKNYNNTNYKYYN